VLQTFEWVEEMLMGQIPSSIRGLIALVIVVIVATLAQRKWGPKALWWVWFASAGIITTVTVAWIFYKHGLPSTQALFQHAFVLSLLVAYLLSGVLFATGGVIWWVAVLGPRPAQDSSAEVNYFPFELPTGGLEDTYGLAGILRRYDELLKTFSTSLDTALASTPLNPYLSPPRAFLRGFRIYHPSFLRQARVSRSRFDRVPSALARDLAGASTVLAELETLTTAQLSAIEECHRVNVRRLRRRTILGWPWGTIAVVCAACAAAITSVVSAAEKVAGVKPSDLWPLIRDATLTGVTLQSNLIIVLYGLVMLLMFLLINIWTFLPALRRAQAFEDILTIAKAYRKGPSETTKPSAQPAMTVTE
jgi:hypothetical protein